VRYGGRAIVAVHSGEEVRRRSSLGCSERFRRQLEVRCICLDKGSISFEFLAQRQGVNRVLEGYEVISILHISNGKIRRRSSHYIDGGVADDETRSFCFMKMQVPFSYKTKYSFLSEKKRIRSAVFSESSRNCLPSSAICSLSIGPPCSCRAVAFRLKVSHGRSYAGNAPETCMLQSEHLINASVQANLI
jgi:hypothetical protein